MKKSIFLMAAMIFAVACGGNSRTNNNTEEQTATTREERIDEITADAKDAFRNSTEAVSDVAEEVGQHAKASLTKGEKLYNKAKVEIAEAAEATKVKVVEAADVVSKKSVEFGAVALEKGAEAMEKGSEALREVRQNME